ncbi:hypothetical protein QTP70_016250 [Hemibagrus guttatus]|uniref:Reverse transcriptase domain-containing protein n=1 Tax=Hemibagrus guttatus TaxID=175788 RepID=A0AAE0PR82_9TELE|nr:hypothetical protein QTP70_016250 [Hemibagrus guttatus]
MAEVIGKEIACRFQQFNNISPGNLSLLISDLREEDQGDYRCITEKEHRNIRIYVKDVLNSFYTRFEARNDTTVRKTIPPPENQVLCLTTADMRKTLRRINPRKAAGPDNVPGRVLRECAEQLVDVFTDIFNISLSSAIVPTCLMTTTIIPFSIQHNHSSAPDREAESAGTNTSLCNWILDFLTGRPQSVQIGNSISSTTTQNTGASQGCILSPLLYTLLTHDCAAMHRSNHIIKLANDTTVVGLVRENYESAYREEVQQLTAWCKANNLSLNIEKTKEMVVDFRRPQSDHSL